MIFLVWLTYTHPINKIYLFLYLNVSVHVASVFFRNMIVLLYKHYEYVHNCEQHRAKGHTHTLVGIYLCGFITRAQLLRLNVCFNVSSCVVPYTVLIIFIIMTNSFKLECKKSTFNETLIQDRVKGVKDDNLNSFNYD